VVGAGAIGGVVGAHLASAGHEITLVDVAPDHVARMRERGLRVRGAAELHVRPLVLTPEELPDRLGTVLLAVKARHTQEALRAVAPRLAPDGCVVSLQNGFEEHGIAAVVGPSRTLGAFLTFGGYYAAPGEVVYSGPGSFRVGEIDGTLSPRALSLARCFTESFHPCEATDNIFGYLWAEEALGAYYFATALVDADVIDIIRDRRWRRPLGALVAEVARIAEAEGVRCEAVDGFDCAAFLRDPRDPDAETASWAAQIAYWDGHAGGQRRTGVWRDLAIHRRPTEAAATLGPLRRRARRRGLRTPTLDRLLDMIGEAERGERRLGFANLEELEVLTSWAP
jgi:2-dehydropantoate 2-reductase